MQQMTVISSLNEKEQALHQFPSKSTIKDVKSLWAQHMRSDLQKLTAKTEDNATIPNQTKLCDIPYFHDDCPIVYLSIEEGYHEKNLYTLVLMKSVTSENFICRRVPQSTTVKALLEQWKVETGATGDTFEIRTEKNVLLSHLQSIKDVVFLDPHAPFVYLKVVDINAKENLVLVIIASNHSKSHLSLRVKPETKVDYLVNKWCKTFDCSKENIYFRTAKGRKISMCESLKSLCRVKNDARIVYIVVEKYIYAGSQIDSSFFSTLVDDKCCGPDVAIFGSSILVDLMLPGERRLQHLVHPCDTVQSLVDDLIRKRELFSVDDLRIGQRSLLHTSTGERDLLINDCGLETGDEICVLTTLPLRVRIVCYPPQEIGRDIKVDLTSGDGIPEMLKKASQTLKIDKEDFNCAFQYGRLSDNGSGFTEHSVVTYSSAAERHVIVNRWGDVIEDNNWTHLTEKPLMVDDLLQVPPGCMPSVYVFLKTKFLSLPISADIPLHFLGNNVEVMLDEMFLAYFGGVIVEDVVGKGKPKIFAFVNGNCYVDVFAGNIHTNRRSLSCSTEIKIPMNMRRWSHFIALIKEGDKLPKFKLPKKHHLLLMTREALQVRLIDGALSRIDFSGNFGARWVTPSRLSQLEKDLSLFFSS